MTFNISPGKILLPLVATLALSGCAATPEPVAPPKRVGAVYDTELPSPLKKSLACVSKNIDDLGEFKSRVTRFPRHARATLFLSVEDAPEIFVIEFAGKKGQKTAVQIFVKPGMNNFNNLLREQVDACKPRDA